jgi:alpha-aminoadipate carrier protein LysW
MQITCVDCGRDVGIHEDILSGEIITCPDCGLDYVVEADKSGNFHVKELTIEGEDWGE